MGLRVVEIGTGSNWMLCSAWPHANGNLASTRHRAAVFLDNLEGVYGAINREKWVATCTKIGDAHCLVGDLNVDEGAFDEAIEAWLCALTVLEVAKRLVDEDDPQGRDISANLEAIIQRLRSVEKVERIQIACDDHSGFPAYYLPAAGPDLDVPAVVCISGAEKSEGTLLARILPVVRGRGMSTLVVSHDDVSSRWRGQSQVLLSCCLDYLSARPDVDATRIGVYGEGLSAALATDVAGSDRRIAAAVCDGGLWSWARTPAAIGWLTGAAVALDEESLSARRLRLVRQLKCPVLVVAGGSGIASVSEATKLQSDCAAARINLELAIPRIAQTPVGEIENFVASDDFIFGWLERKLVRSSASRPLSAGTAERRSRQR